MDFKNKPYLHHPFGHEVEDALNVYIYIDRMNLELLEEPSGAFYFLKNSKCQFELATKLTIFCFRMTMRFPFPAGNLLHLITSLIHAFPLFMINIW